MKDKLNFIQRGFIKTMGIDKYVADYEANRALSYLKGNADSPVNYKEEEFRTWYYGTPFSLEYFYKKYFNHEQFHDHNFWRSVNTDMVRVHSPFAATISNTFGALLFYEKPNIRIDANKVSLTKDYQKRLNKIMDVNDFLSLLQEGAQLQSYSGSVGLKLNVDRGISDTPLITLYPKERMNVERKFGQIIYIDFYDYYENGKYILVSRYGRGYINYRLYKGKDEVSLSVLPETADLKDTAFYSDSKMLPIIFAEAIQNKSGERSDYDGLIPLFQALDETYSSMMNYIRKTKPNTKITEDLLEVNPNTDKPLPRSDFDDNIIILDAANDPEGKTSFIERDITDIDVSGFENTIQQIKEEILMKVSLSPGTLGLQTGGAKESSEALEIRERASVRIRQEKLSIWKEKLATFLSAAILLDTIIPNLVDNIDIYDIEELPDFEIIVDFSEYKTVTFENKQKIFMEQYEKGLIPLAFALISIYGDKYSKEQILELIIATKNEKGLTLTSKEEEYFNKNQDKMTLVDLI